MGNNTVDPDGDVILNLEYLNDPFARTAATLKPVLRTSAEAALRQCTGGDAKRQYGFYWSEGVFVKPSSTGVGETMSVLSAVQGLLAVELEGKKAVGTGNGGGSGGGAGGGTGGGGAGKTAEPNSTAAATGKSVEGIMWMAIASDLGAMVM